MIIEDQNGELIIWPNGSMLLTHEEIDAVIEAFQKLKLDFSPEEIEFNNREADADRFRPRKREKSIPLPPEDKSGYIYVLLSEKIYKIGRSIEPSKRIDTYRTENPYPIKLVLLAKVDKHIQVELDLLEVFSDKRMHGEWFKLCKQDIRVIRDFILSRGGMLVDLP